MYPSIKPFTVAIVIQQPKPYNSDGHFQPFSSCSKMQYYDRRTGSYRAVAACKVLPCV